MCLMHEILREVTETFGVTPFNNMDGCQHVYFVVYLFISSIIFVYQHNSFTAAQGTFTAI